MFKRWLWCFLGLTLCLVPTAVRPIDAQGSTPALLYRSNYINVQVQTPDFTGKPQNGIATLIPYDSGIAWSETRAALALIGTDGQLQLADRLHIDAPLKLTQAGSERRYFFNPAWSPDGRWIGAVVNQLIPQKPVDNVQLAMILSAYEVNTQKLLPIAGPLMPDGSQRWMVMGQISWSPDGTRIAFEAHAPDIDPWDIYIVTTTCLTKPEEPCAVNSLPRPIATSPDSNRSERRFPVWLPDGQSIAYACGKLCVLKLDGSNLREYPTAADLTQIALSPDGRYFAYESKGDIFTLDLTTGQETNVTNTPNQIDRAPIWITLPAGDYLIAKK